MKYKLAKIISTVFNPAIFFILMPYIILGQRLQVLHAFRWEFFSYGFMFLGGLLFFLAVRRGIFSDEDVSIRSERYEFYFLSLVLALVYLGFAVFFRGFFFPLSIITIGLIFGILAALYFNQFMKVSIHVGVACAFVCSIALLYGIGWLLLGAVIVPLLVWARVLLHEHTPKEVLVGGMLGIVITLATFLAGHYII